MSTVIPEKLALKYCVFPIKISDTKLEIYMRKYDISVINTLSSISKRDIVVKIKGEEEIYSLIKKNYNIKFTKEENFSEYLISGLVKSAVELKASDIHIEPYSSEVRIRLRINGDLKIKDRLSLEDYPELNTIIKLKSGCDITEKRIPQDGRFTYSDGKYQVDIRLSTVPTVYGEKLVMRLLSHDDFIKKRSGLGFSKNSNIMIDNMLSKDCGMLIISGTTGSGKSSTVYSILNELIKKDINVTTIEDPVEYKIDGINQIQVNNKVGIRFDNGLKSILRQDPDCIVLGEIRDKETAEIAVRAAITGHFVISTLHTNDAISTIARLVDMGIEPYLINAALIGVVSQKLIKKKLVVEGDFSDERTLIYEILVMDDEIRKMIKDKRDSVDIRKVAIANGMRTYEDSINEKNKG